jgi:hypothetical protein
MSGVLSVIILLSSYLLVLKKNNTLKYKFRKKANSANACYNFLYVFSNVYDFLFYSMGGLK